MPLGPSPWIFSSSSSVAGYCASNASRFSKLPRRAISSSAVARPLPMPGTSVIFPLRAPQNILDPLRIAFDHRGRVAVAADAEAVLGRDLHQVRGLGQEPRDLTIFHASRLKL